MTTLNRLFKIEFESGGGGGVRNWKRAQLSKQKATIRHESSKYSTLSQVGNKNNKRKFQSTVELESNRRLEIYLPII